MANSWVSRQSGFVGQISRAGNTQLVLPELNDSSLVSPYRRKAETNSIPSDQLRGALGKRRMPAGLRARMDAYFKKLNADREEMLDFAARGNYLQARRRLEAAMLSAPKLIGAEFYSLPLMDLEIDRNDYKSAYQVAAGFIKSGRATYDILLRGSLAAAALGEVYAGQREFLIAYIQGKDPSNEYGQALSLPGNSPESVAALSRILIGSELESQGKYARSAKYWEAALKRDPGNPVICYALADCYGMTYQYSLGIRTAQAGLARARSERIRIGLLDKVHGCELCLAEVGDGRPADGGPAVMNPPNAIKPQQVIHP